MSKALWFNALGFQGVWWALALGVPRGFGVLSALIASAYLIWQWQQAKHRNLVVLSVMSCAALGLVADTLLGLLGGVTFTAANPAPFEGIQPWWLCLLWMSLGCTLHSSLQWLCHWPKLSVLLSAVAGVASYEAAIPLGLMHWQSSAAYWVLVFVWGMCFPVLLFALNGRWPNTPQPRSEAQRGSA
jgi:hypothetical protein